MRFTTFLATIALSASTAYAAAETMVHNKCDFSIFYAAVDSSPPGNITEIPPHTYILQDEWYDGISGTALKITTSSDGLFNNKPVLNFAYTLRHDEIWYDLTAVGGYDFSGKKVTLEGDAKGSEKIVWDGAPGPARIAHWAGPLDLRLTLCA